MKLLTLIRPWLHAVNRIRPQFARLARVMRRAAARRIAGLVEQIAQHEKGLNRFGRESDAEFTRLARGLGQLNQRLADVRGQTAALDRVLKGEDEDRALASAYTVYKNSVDLVHSSVGIAVSEQEQMAAVEAGLARVCDAHEMFRRNSLMFRMLAMGVRMEAARLDAENQTTFSNVASAITEIEQHIAETTAGAFDRIEQVVTETAAERQHLRQVQSWLHDRAQSSIRTIHAELQNVEQALRPCAEESRAIAGLLAETTPPVTRLITALQFQDIVRQKLEHVALGFADLVRHVRQPAVSKSVISVGALDHGYLYHAAQLQGRQLEGARAEIERAGNEITTHMSALLEVTDSLVSRFNAMHEAATSAFLGCRVAQLFKEEIGKLAGIVTQSEQSNQKIAALVSRIEEIITVFSGDIGKHEFDVKLVALNAQIAAARLPSADALNRLAEEAIRVASANAQVTQELAVSLAATLGQLSRIKREAGEFLDVIRAEKAALETGAVAVSEKLHRLGDGIQSSATVVNRDFAAVHGEIRQMLDELQFPAQIALCWEPAQQTCAALCEITQELASDALEAESRAKLDAHQRRYTTRAEHDAHVASLAAASGDAPSRTLAVLSLPADPNATSVAAEANAAKDTTAEPALAATKSESLGDGIELF